MGEENFHILVFICASTIFFVGILVVITFVYLRRKKSKFLELESKFKTFL
jgi:amino acid transporter